MMAGGGEREYVRLLNTVGDMVHVRFTKKRGKIERYTAQLEVFADGRYYPAVRYDSAHGRPHRDLLDWEGRVIDKDWVISTSFEEALTEAIRTINQSWPELREAFFRRRP